MTWRYPNDPESDERHRASLDREAREHASERAYCEEILRLRASFIGVCEDVERIRHAYWENTARAVALEAILARLRPGIDPWPYAEIEAALSGDAGRALLARVAKMEAALGYAVRRLRREEAGSMAEGPRASLIAVVEEALKP